MVQVEYKLVDCSAGLQPELELRPSFRDYHSTTHENDTLSTACEKKTHRLTAILSHEEEVAQLNGSPHHSQGGLLRLPTRRPDGPVCERI
jgi:hypothetical protein